MQEGGESNSNANNNEYITDLILDHRIMPNSYDMWFSILEINRLTQEGGESNGNANDSQKLKEPDFINAFSNQRPKIECHLKIPVENFPGVNFVGKILGPGGSTLKRVQESTNTGIAILGKGSQRDDKKVQFLFLFS